MSDVSWKRWAPYGECRIQRRSLKVLHGSGRDGKTQGTLSIVGWPNRSFFMAKSFGVVLALGFALLQPALADGVHGGSTEKGTPQPMGRSVPLDSLGSGITVETLARSDRSWNGQLLPLFGAAQPEVTVVRLTVPAGVTLKRHMHPVIHAGVLVQGKLRVETDNGSSQLLEAGQAIIEVVNTAHRSVSLGPDSAVLLMVFVGPVGQAITLPATP